MTDAFPPPRGTDAAGESPPVSADHGSAAGGAPFDAPPVLDEPSSDVPSSADRPSGRSHVPLIVVGILAVVALVVGVIVAVSGGSSSSDEAFSLDGALESASEATTVEYDMTMTAETPAGDVPLTAQAAADSDAGLMRMEIDAADLLPGEMLPGASGTIEMILDGSTSTMYMRAGDLFGDVGGFLGADVEWISFDLDDLYELGGIGGADPVDDIAGMFDQSPLAMLGGVAELADDAEVIGTDTIDGEELRHFRVVVDDPADIYDNPDTEAAVDIFDDLVDLGGDGEVGALEDLIDDVTYDFWVTEDSVLRRIEVSVGGPGLASSVVFQIDSIGEPIDLSAPSDDEVFSFDDLLGG